MVCDLKGGVGGPSGRLPRHGGWQSPTTSLGPTLSLSSAVQLKMLYDCCILYRDSMKRCAGLDGRAGCVQECVEEPEHHRPRRALASG